MAAAQSLLDMEEERSAIPGNVVSYTTQSTTFVFERGQGALTPFPWDAAASDDIRSFWLPQRASFFSAV